MKLDHIYAAIEYEPNSGCWIYSGCLDRDGYGRATIRENGTRRTRIVHRVVYEAHKGKIPEGLVADHKCKVRSCCNPDHIEPVTAAENQRRGDSGKASRERALARSACSRGHIYNEVGVYWHTDGRRRCAECARLATRRYLSRKATA